MNRTEKNRAKRDRQRHNRIMRMVDEVAKGYGQDLMDTMPTSIQEQLKSMPHPKRPDLDYLTAYSYIEWMCGMGWHKKATKVINELIPNAIIK